MPRGVKAEASAEKPAATKPTTIKLGIKSRDALGPKSLATTPEAPPVLDVKELEARRKEINEGLRKCEVQIFKLESQYFDTANPQGNALKGYDGLMSSTQVSAKKAQFRPEDRIFSGSSGTGAQPS